MNKVYKRILSVLCACFCAMFSFAFLAPNKSVEASAELVDTTYQGGDYYVELPFLDYTTQFLPTDDAVTYLMYRSRLRYALHFAFTEGVSSVGLAYNNLDGIEEYTDISYFGNINNWGQFTNYEFEYCPITTNQDFYFDYALIKNAQFNLDEFEFNDGYSIVNSYPYSVSYSLEARSSNMLYCDIIIDFADLYYPYVDESTVRFSGICYISISLPISNAFFMTQSFNNGGVLSQVHQDTYYAYGYTYTAAPYLTQIENIVNNARNDGFDQGYAEGNTAGYVRGRADGYTQGLEDSESFNFKTLISAVVDVPINAFRSLFNFNFLGFNVANFMLSLMTIGLAFSILRLLI